MNSRDAFKYGFMLGCADQGLTGTESVALMQKAAQLLEKEGGINDILNFLGTTAGTAAVAAPIAAGAGMGYLAHRAAVPEIDEDSIHKQELIEELRHYARRAKEQNKVKALRLSLQG